jgi:hypothetical protein
MAFKTFDVAQCPQLPGRSSSPAVNIGDNGGLAFSRKAAVAMEGCNFVQVAYDEDNNRVLLQGAKAVPPGREGQYLKLTRGKSGDGVGFAASRFLITVGYPYRTSGNQRYEAEVNSAKKQVLFTLNMSPVAKPKVPRPHRKKAESEKTNSQPAAAAMAPAQPGEFQVA